MFPRGTNGQGVSQQQGDPLLCLGAHTHTPHHLSVGLCPGGKPLSGCVFPAVEVVFDGNWVPAHLLVLGKPFEDTITAPSLSREEKGAPTPASAGPGLSTLLRGCGLSHTLSTPVRCPLP